MQINVFQALPFVKCAFDGHAVSIHPTAVIAADVILGKGVVIHPYVVIEAGAVIGDDVEIFPGAYIGKEPKGAGALARQPSFHRQITIGAHCSIGPHVVIYHDVIIGRNTLIGDGASIREKVTIGDFCIISRGVTINYNTQIGNKTKIMDLTHITGNCFIGDEVFISALVSTTNDNALGKATYDESAIKGPIIQKGVAIGASSSILPGVTLGEYSIVGAGSIVTKDVSPWVLVIGVPARKVRTLDNTAI